MSHSRVVQLPSSTTPLVLGILGLVFCALLAPFAWRSGSRYIAECDRLGVVPSGAGVAGKILGIVGTILLLIGLLFILAAAVIAASAQHLR